MESLPATPRQRLVELDGLRGLAALAVLIFHFTTRYDAFFGHRGAPIGSFSKGSYGVELFFIISGFVILMTISRSKTIWDFAVSRFARLYPVYWVSIVVTLAVVTMASLWPEGQPSSIHVLLNFTMLQDFLGAQNVDGVYWTLQIELVFYALIAVLFVTRMISSIELVSMFLLAISMVDSWYLGSALPESPVGNLARDLLRLGLVQHRIAFFTTGMMLYLCWKAGITPLRLAVIGLGPMSTFAYDGWDSALMHVAFAALVGFAVADRARFLRSRPFSFLGVISYSLYLVHQFVGYVVIHELEVRGLNANLAILVAAFAMIGLATMLTFGVERPANSLIRRTYRSLVSNRHLSLHRVRNVAA